MLLKNSKSKKDMIKVSSEYTKGSIFSFSIYWSQLLDIDENVEILEIKKSKSQVKFPKSIPPKPKDSNENRKVLDDTINILAVDDDPFCLDVVVKFLEIYGIINIYTAKNGKEAIDTVIEESKKGKNFAFIVMDCNMPVLDGFEATKQIRELSNNKLIPFVDIIALTANVATADENTCKEAGMNHYLKKPIQKNVFFSKINDILTKLNKK